MKRQVNTSFGATLTLFCVFATSLAGAQTILNTSTPIPINLTAQGSYKLGQSIGSGAGNYINISGNDVTLDLNGYNIVGANSCSKTAHVPGNSCVGAGGMTSQVLVNITGSRVTVKNGSIIGSQGSGIAVSGSYVRLESLNVAKNLGWGITASVAGTGSSADRTGMTLNNVNASLNGLTGFDGPGSSSGDAIIRNSVFSDNNGGVLVNDTANLDQVTASNNALYGIRGGHAVITGGSVVGNGGDGVSDGSVVKNVAAEGNVTGFKSNGTFGTVYINDSAFNNTAGFVLGTSGCYSNIFASGNTTNLSGGIALTGTHVTCP